MPKTLSVILREELRKHGIELLDIYCFRDYDLIRVYNKQAGKVFLYQTKNKISSLPSRDELVSVVIDIVKRS
ncbi:MAG: hypothetical protein QXE81_02470 [Desulfurococcaceae archaeon]